MSRRRALLTAAVVVAVVALLAVIPALPPVRGYLVARIVEALRDGGTDVDFSRTSGNAWRGITLEDVVVKGAGIDAQVERVRVGYFLPSLLGGELPLDVHLGGARGDLDLSELLSGVAGGPAGPAGPIAVLLRRLTLEDVEVSVAEAPFALPDATISQLEVDQKGTILDLEGTVTTAEGEARIAGRFETITGTFDGRLVRADAAIARHWWQGIQAGAVSGDIDVRGGAITGRFTIEDAAVNDVGLLATGVDGTVELDYPVITARLTGDTLGGPVTAAGIVNVEAELWEAEAEGEVALDQAAGWLLRGSYPDGPPVDVSGRADVSLNLRGWDHLALEGSATGDGAVAGLSLEALSTSFRLPRDGQVRVEGTASLGGGPLEFDLGPGTAGDRLLVTASSVDLSSIGAGLGSADAELRLAMDGRQDGDLTVAWAGTLAGRDATARLDARLDPDGWQGFVTGSDTTGAQLEGAVVLANDRIDGGASLTGLVLPSLPDSTRLTLGVSGPSDLNGARLTLALDADEPITPDVLDAGPDLRGSLAGTWSGGSVTGIVGRLGPVSLSGTLDLDPLTFTSDLLMEPTPLELAGGGVRADVTVPQSVIALGPDGLEWDGRVDYANVAAGPSATPDGAAAAALSISFADAAEPWGFTARSEREDLSVDAGPAGVSARLDGLPVSLAGAAPDRPALTGELTGDVQGTTLDLTVAPTDGGQVALPAALSLAGGVDPATSRLDLAGNLGALPVTLTADWTGPLNAVAQFDPGSARTLLVSYDAETQAVGISGGADLGRLAQLVAGTEEPIAAATLDIDLTGTLVGGAVTGLAGNGTVLVEEPFDLRADLTGRGDDVGVTLTGEAAGLPVNGAGRIDLADLGGDEPLLTVDVGPVSGLEVRSGGVTGEGVLAGLSAGPLAVPELPWSLQARWTDGITGAVTVAGSTVDLTLRDDALLVSGPLRVPVTYAGEDLVASVAVEGGRLPLSDLARLGLTADLSTPGGPPLLTASGTPERLDIAGELPLQLVAAPLPEDARPTGSLSVAGTADALAQSLRLEVGDDVLVSLQEGRLSVAADAADLTPYLPGRAPSGLSITLDGVLMADPGRGWNGGLRAELSLPGVEPTQATVMLTGSGQALSVSATATGPMESTLRVDGQLAPELRLTGEASALGGAVTADLAADPVGGLIADLRSTGFVADPHFTVPPLQATVTLPSGAPGPKLTGDWIAAEVTEDGELRGAVHLAFTLLDEPALLEAQLAGTLTDPSATATLTGAGVSATAEGDTGTASAALTLTQPAVTAALPAGAAEASSLITSPVDVAATWDAEAGSGLTAYAVAQPPGTPMVALDLWVGGAGASYQGDLSASLPDEPSAGPVVTAQVAGTGGDLSATVDLASVDYRTIGAAFGADVEVAGTGRVALGTTPTTLDVEVDLSGTVEGAEVTLAGLGPDDLTFTLAAPEAQLAGRLAWNEQRRVVVSGQVAGRPVDAWLELADDLETGRLHVDVPGAKLEAQLATRPDGVRTASVAGQLLGEGVAGFAGGVRAQVLLDGGSVEVADLRAEVASAPGLGDRLPLVLDGSGSLAPTVALEGTVSSPAAGVAAAEGRWHVGGTPLQASLEWLGLEVVYAFGPGEVTVSAPGDVSPAIAVFAPDLEGLDLVVQGPGLTWNPSSGFAGRLSAAAEGELVPEQARPAVVTLTGDGSDLTVDLAAGAAPDGSPLAHLVAEVPAQALTSGQFAADVSVTGEVEASGTLSVSGGEAQLNLAGDGLEAAARLSGSGWSVEARLDEFAIGETIPQLADPTLSLALTGGSATGGIAVEDIVLASGESSVTGSASLDGRLRAALRAQLDLADLELGETRLTGVLRGPVVVVAPSVAQVLNASVTAQLDAAGVGVVGVPTQVDGALQVGGTVTDPVVFALLNGRGDLRGSLRLEAAPARGRIDLRSSLAYGDVTTDIRANVGPESVVASGSIRAADAVLLIADTSEGLSLTGAGRLEGWTATVSPGLESLEAEGPLAEVAPGLAGRASLRIGAAGDARAQSDSGASEAAGTAAWLRAELTDLVVAGQEVGSLTLTSAAAGAPIDVSGQGVSGRVDPMDQTWVLSVTGFALAAGVEVALTAEGQGTSGQADLLASGGGPLALDAAAHLTLSPTGAGLSVSGSVLGGELSLSGARDAAGLWTGQVDLRGAGLPADDPTAALVATGVLQGSQALPQVVLGTALYASGAGAAAAGRVTLGPSGVTLDQSLAVPNVRAPLRVQGRVAPGLDLTLGGAGTEAGQPRGQVRLREAASGLTAAGALDVPLGQVTAELSGSGGFGSPRLTLTPSALPDAELVVDLAARDLNALVARVSRDGLAVTGTGSASGGAVLTLDPEPRLELRGLGLTASGFTVQLSGPLTTSEAQLSGSLTLPLTVADPDLAVLPLRITASDGTWRLDSDGPLGSIDAEFDTVESRALVDVALAVPATGAEGVAGQVTGGSVAARLAYDPVSGPTGTLSLADVSLEPPGWGTLTVGAEATLADGRIGGAATVQGEAGSVSLTGDAPVGLLVPAADAAADADEGDLQVRLRAVELSELPVVAAVAPYLSGAVSGVVQVRDGFVLGQLLAPELAVGDTALPVTAQVSGPLSRVDMALVTGGSLVSLTLADMELGGVARLERFPLDLLAEAVVGPSDVSTLLTGVARIDLPLDDLSTGYAALASEELTLERAGVVTQGELTLTYDAGALRVDRATFSGRGEWRASGVLAPDELDFELVAEEADFGPLLGIFPALAQYGVGADGSFTFRASGDLGQPLVTFETDALDVQVAGASYRLEDADIRIEGPELAAELTLRSLAPVTGELLVSGQADVSLDPVALRAVDVGFEGDLAVPGLGRLEGVHGTITQDPQFRPFLALSGELGSPFSVQGTLVPLDLRAGGTGLRVSYPSLLIADATVGADLRLRSEDGGVVLGGVIRAEEVVLDPAASGAQASAAAEGQASSEGQQGAQAQATTQESDDPGATSISPEGVPASPVNPPAPAPEPERSALAGLRFDDLRITAPQRVVLTTSFASLEAALDLTLSGTGAEPRLTGDARTIRGSLRFAGREFTLDRAVATFTANRGVLPDLDVSAHTEFEKTRVLTGNSDVSFAAPDGRTFRVDLAFRGPVERTEEGQLRFDVDPALTSDALIEVTADPDAPAAPAGGGVRPLTEAELLTLVTLGRLELGSDLIGAGGLGGAVAQGALDTAVDVLLLGEFQNALREALGLDVFEIRTSAFSSLLEGDGDPFGVSVRLGGYLNPELFASYTIGTADPDDPGFAVTNEVALEYALGPLDLEISGRLDFPMSGVLASPRSELGLGLAYQLGGTVGLDLSTSLSTDRSAVSFGVTFRW